MIFELCITYWFKNKPTKSKKKKQNKTKQNKKQKNGIKPTRRGIGGGGGGGCSQWNNDGKNCCYP